MRRIRSGCCARAMSGHAAAAPPPSATNNSRRPMVTVIRPSRARCVKATIPRHEHAVFTSKEGPKAAAGDMQAIKELADRLDGKPAQMLEHSGPDSEPITKVVNEFVHVHETREQIEFNDQPPLLEINPSKNGGNTH